MSQIALGGFDNCGQIALFGLAPPCDGAGSDYRQKPKKPKIISKTFHQTWKIILQDDMSVGITQKIMLLLPSFTQQSTRYILQSTHNVGSSVVTFLQHPIHIMTHYHAILRHRSRQNLTFKRILQNRSKSALKKKTRSLKRITYYSYLTLLKKLRANKT